MVLSANIVHMKRVPWVAFSSRWDGVVGLAHRSREVEAERQNKGREVDAGGNAAREGERDACGGRGAHFLVVRH